MSLKTDAERQRDAYWKRRRLQLCTHDGCKRRRAPWATKCRHHLEYYKVMAGREASP